MEKKELEKELEALKRQLDKERTEKKQLESRISEQPSSPLFGKISFLLSRFKKVSPDLEGRLIEEEETSVVTKSALEESVSDDIATYQKKLASYSLQQLEDIYFHLDKDSHPDRYLALCEELRKR